MRVLDGNLCDLPVIHKDGLVFVLTRVFESHLNGRDHLRDRARRLRHLKVKVKGVWVRIDTAVTNL